MDGRYLGSGFTERRATSGETADWAYCNPTSSSYGGTHMETELPLRQSYTSSHTLTNYTTSQHPTGASGVFETSLHTTEGSTAESSVMNFISSVESRGLQAGPAATSLLPQFRTSPWQTGTSPSTELFLTGALPSSGTFPTLSALSSYQHPSTFPARSFATTSALTVQHTTFSPSNGLLSPNDPLLQIKSTQSTVPTAFAFDRLCGASLGSSLPIQSSTYRSAQESAPHLLQPQFSLLPSPLSNSQQTTPPYGAPIFSTSIERALQRECSVIKHLQRPSSTQSVQQQQLPASAQNSMQDYLPEDDVSYQDPSRHTPLPNSPNGIPSQAINSTVQQKTTTVQLPQTQSPSLPSSGFSSTCGVKAKDDSNKTAEHLGEGSELHDQAVSSPMQQHRYASTAQKQSSVIASQSQPYTSAQLSSLMSGSPSQTYITSQSLISNLNEPQVFSPNQPVKLPSIYKTLPSLATQSENETSVSHSLMYASGQKHIMSSASNREEYNEQAQRLCIGNASQSYSSSYSQSLSTVSYFSQGQESVSPSQSYASGKSLTPSPPFSSSYAHNLPSSNSTQDYTQIPPSPSKTDGMLLQQTQKYLLSDQSTSSTATYTEAIQNQSSVEQSPAYGKRKEDKSLFLTTKENCGELPVQEMQALQQASISSSTQSVTNSVIGVQSNVVYVVSKMEDRQAHSVIRSNSRSDDQLIGLSPMSSTKDERMSILTGELLNPAHSHVISGTKNISTLMQSSHVALSTDLMKEHPVLLKVPSAQQENQQTLSNRDQRQLSQERAQFVQLPSAQVLLEPSQMILLQKPLLHTGSNQSKPIQMQPVSVQFLQMNNEILNSTVSTVEIPQITHQAVESLKQHLVQKDSFSNSTNQHDAKQHFTLSSICFPDSMLMADERNILSNVDDILAATAAACGVTPQDYKSSSSEGDLASISSPPDSKCHYELVNNKHGANGFSLQNMIPKTQTNTLSVNGGQLTTDFHKEIDGHQAFTSISHTQQNNSKMETSEEVTNHHKKPKGLISNEFSLNTNGCTINPIANNHTDFHPTSQEYNPTEFEKAETISKNKVEKSVKSEERFAECLSDVFSKKRVRSKGSSQQATEDENDQPKSQKRSGQVKRQNSKGSETSSFSVSEGCLDSYQQQERIWQKIKEVEEKQPEVKTGFIGSFLDFLKSGPKQQFSSPPIRSPNRTRKACVPKRPLNQLSLPPKPIPQSTTMDSADMNSVSSTKRLDEELQKNLETLPSFSSDEDELVGKNQDLQKSISSALSSLDEPSDKQSVSKGSGEGTTSDTNPISAQSADTKPKEQQNPGLNQVPVEELVKNISPGKLAVCLTTVAIEGLTDEDLSDSGEEGMYRERDEFVVKNEDIESLQVTLKAGIEPPAIWKVQKALLQKFIPELREGKRVFSATNSYLGYFGDAKTLYQRVYVKFLDTVNKREYVRVCNRKPRCKPMHSIRGSQKSLLAQRATAQAMSDSSASKSSTKQSLSKPRPKQTKAKAEPPPKKRKKWKEEFTESTLLTSPEAVGKGDEFTPPVPFASRFLNTRTMKETFKSFVELLISVALDADVMITLERENDELLLPHMKRVDGMITDNRRRLLSKLQVGQVFKNALDSFPELSVVTELKTDGETPAFKVRLSGKAYNRKTMKPTKSHNKPPLEYTVEQQKTQWFSLYHSLQHYKYHTYLICMNEIALLRSHGADLGQEETVQTCMRNRAWVEDLFDRFGELLTQVQQACL